MNKPYFIKCILFSLVLLLLNACKSKKLISPIESTTHASWQKTLNDHNINFDWFGSKSTIKFEDDIQRFSGKLYLRMKKNESIWMVGKKLGVEGARILIRPDSVFLINRLERNYAIKSFDKMKEEFGLSIDFEELQTLLAGNILYSEQDAILNIETENGNDAITTSLRDLLTKYWIDTQSAELVGFKTSDGTNRTMLVDLENYQTVQDSLTTAFKRTYTIPDTDTGELMFEMNMSSIEFNIIQNMPFEIPSHYTKID